MVAAQVTFEGFAELEGIECVPECRGEYLNCSKCFEHGGSKVKMRRAKGIGAINTPKVNNEI